MGWEGTHYQQTAQLQLNICNNICNVIRWPATAWLLCRDSVGISLAEQSSVRAVGREGAVPKVTALGRDAGPRVNASVRQNNYSVDKLMVLWS